MRTANNSGKAVIKVKFNGDQKRIPQEKEISYVDLIRRCRKSFALEADTKYGLLVEEGEVMVGTLI